MFSCDKKKDPNLSTLDFKYPLEIGNEWNYKVIIKTDHYSTEVPDSIIYSETVNDIYTIKVESEILLDDVTPTIKVTCENITNELYAVQYYTTDNSGLFCFAYNTFGMPPFVKSSFQKEHLLSNIFPVLKSQNIDSLEIDTLVYETPPAPALLYPITIGEKWLLRETSFTAVYKTVSQKDIFNNVAGNFECFRLDYSYSNPDIFKLEYFYDLVSAEGLIYRSIKSDKLIDIVGETFRYTETYELISYDIN